MSGASRWWDSAKEWVGKLPSGLPSEVAVDVDGKRLRLSHALTQPRAPRWTWRLVALGAMGLVQSACGTGTYDLTCSVNEDCLESELCHPDQKLCVQMCTTNAECPAEAKSCQEISEENRQKICKCLTEECVNGTDP